MYVQDEWAVQVLCPLLEAHSVESKEAQEPPVLAERQGVQLQGHAEEEAVFIRGQKACLEGQKAQESPALAEGQGGVQLQGHAVQDAILLQGQKARDLGSLEVQAVGSEGQDTAHFEKREACLEGQGVQHLTCFESRELAHVEGQSVPSHEAEGQEPSRLTTAQTAHALPQAPMLVLHLGVHGSATGMHLEQSAANVAW